jgi:hypothetical protein
MSIDLPDLRGLNDYWKLEQPRSLRSSANKAQLISYLQDHGVFVSNHHTTAELKQLVKHHRHFPDYLVSCVGTHVFPAKSSNLPS